MRYTEPLFITPESDVKVLLGRKPFPLPFTHLSVDTDIEHDRDSFGLIALSRITGRTLKVYNQSKLLATTHHYSISVQRRVVRLWKKDTVLHP